MKETDLNQRVSQKLMEFEVLETIEPSADWNRSMMRKLASAKKQRSEKSISAKSKLLILLLILLNIAFIWKTFTNDTQKTSSSSRRSSELQIISNELFINPESLNN